MKATLSFVVLADDGSVETESTVLWAKCDWNDVTVLQDVLVQTLDRTIELGYTQAIGKGLATPEQVMIARAIAKGEKVLTTTPPTTPGETGRVRK
jgi:hypothetical protein